MAQSKKKHFTVLSSVLCCSGKAPNCKGFVKQNVIDRIKAVNPDADVHNMGLTCFKCTPKGKRDTLRKKERKTYKAAHAAGVPV